jgi:DNA-binding MarR family transcriptional regulator
MPQRNPELADRWIIQAVTLTRWLRAADPDPQLSGPQASAMAIIVYAGRIRPSDLADLEEVKRPTIARTITQLSAMGLIYREADTADARNAFLVPTKKGRTVFAAGQRRRARPLAAALSKLTDAEIKVLERAAVIVERVLPE